jgi:Predicted membrane-associated HD superfamily hydrolase
MIILSILFFVTAILYASVGFGGGSTYLALLLIWGVPYYIFPVIALICNIFVVSGNCFNYIKAGNLNLKLLIPYLMGSIPLSFVGGSLQINKNLFEIFLFIVLSIAGTLLLTNFKSYDDNESSYRNVPIFISIIIGGILGFISGVVGIGGGIFLSPILFLIKAAKPKHIITAASLLFLSILSRVLLVN